jgi:DNA-binding MarR family transcriptional regulator
MSEQSRPFAMREDIETDLANDARLDLRLWLRILACSHWIEDEIRARMKAECGITLTHFNLMAQLERRGGGIMMAELSRRTMVANSSVTALTDQLVELGYVRRQRDSNDRRAIAVHLTERGLFEFRRMAALHEGWVNEMLASLDTNDKDIMFTALGRLKAGLGATLRDSL